MHRKVVKHCIRHFFSVPCQVNRNHLEIIYLFFLPLETLLWAYYLINDDIVRELFGVWLDVAYLTWRRARRTIGDKLTEWDLMEFVILLLMLNTKRKQTRATFEWVCWLSEALPAVRFMHKKWQRHRTFVKKSQRWPPYLKKACFFFIFIEKSAEKISFSNGDYS